MKDWAKVVKAFKDFEDIGSQIKFPWQEPAKWEVEEHKIWEQNVEMFSKAHEILSETVIEMNITVSEEEDEEEEVE